MSFVLMEDLKPHPTKRQHTVVYSIRIIRPFVKLARLTYRSSRLIIRQCAWVIRKVTLRKSAATDLTTTQVQPSNDHR